MKRSHGFLAMLGFFAATAFSQNISTPVMVLKDGDATATKFTGTDKTIFVDGGAQQSVGWTTFQTEGIDVSKIASAKLILYVNTLKSPGTLQIRLLTSEITAPENNVRLTSLPAGATVTATQTLGTADVEKVVQIDLTAAVKSGTFKGVALTSDDGMVASFDSKEGHLRPMIMLTNNVNDVAAAWLSGAAAPAAALGKDGDYYLNTASGNVSAKATGAWAVVTNIVGATGAKGDKGDAGTAGINGVAGAAGASGLDGTSIIWRGPYNPSERYSANDAVHHNGSAYIATARIADEVPGEIIKSNPWQLMASTGTSSWVDSAGKVSTKGNVSISGDLSVAGTIRGRIDVSQVTGLAGQGYTIQFPDVYNNAAKIVIPGVTLTDKVIVLTGPGIDIDRTVIYGSGGHRYDESGFSMEHPFIFEAGGADAVTLIAVFDSYVTSPLKKDFLLITEDVGGNEIGRFIFSSWAPVSYTAGAGGRTRFTFTSGESSPNSSVQINDSGYAYPSYPHPSVTPGIDKGIEIEGIIINLAAPVEVDTVNQTVTINFSIGETQLTLWRWAKEIAKTGTSIAGRKAFTIIELVPNTSGGGSYTSGYDELKRKNYFEAFPIKWELTGGFGLHTKLTGRIVIAYGSREDG